MHQRVGVQGAMYASTNHVYNYLPTQRRNSPAPILRHLAHSGTAEQRIGHDVTLGAQIMTWRASLDV